MAMLRLYHRTEPETARKIYAQKKMFSKENTGEAYFSTMPDGQSVGYGDGLVCIEIPERLAELDDQFPSGEQHYRVYVNNIRPEHFRSL